MESYLVTVVGSAAFFSFLLENLKRAKWFPWLDLHTSTLNKWASIVLATLSGIGINYMWDDVTRTLTLQIPTALGIVSTLWQILIQWAFQKAAYRSFVKEPQQVVLTPKETEAKPA